jgi:hypothetical protein
MSARKWSSLGLRRMLAFITSLFMVMIGACSLVDRIPPDAMTKSAIDETEVRIQMYMKENRETPPSLTDLPIRKDYANRIKDGWGYDLQYTVDSDGAITLMSLGADGKPGGEGLDQDIVSRYKTCNPDGSLNIDDEYWITKAEIK